jgi:FMN phosphatase YigB (HAD superfamily)
MGPWLPPDQQDVPDVTGAVFDFGNVLYQVDYPSMGRALAGDRGEELLAAFEEGNLRIDYESGRASLDDVLREMGHSGFSIPRRRFLEAYLSIFSPVPGALSLVQTLAAHRPLGLLSNTSPEHARLFIEKTPESGCFRERVYSFEVGHMKPAPQTYREICRRLGLPGSELAYTDDVEEYALASSRLGMVGIPFRGVRSLGLRLLQLGFSELEALLG